MVAFLLLPTSGVSETPDVPMTVQDINQQDVERMRVLAVGGDKVAQDFICFAYVAGVGVEQDLAEAVPWCMKAAENGYPGARFTLGMLYVGGHGGLVQDVGKAIQWFERAAEAGNGDAPALLGSMYHVGSGVGRDVAQAYFWTKIAANAGYESARGELVKLQEEMTSEQVEEATRRAGEWSKRFAPQ